MAYLNTFRFDHLSQQEILRRIGGLLAIAVGRLEQQDREKSIEAPCVITNRPTAATTPVATALVGDEIERQIVAHLHKVGVATPRELIAVLGFTKRTITRKLARLRAAGLCQVDGRTRMTCYRLRNDAGAMF